MTFSSHSNQVKRQNQKTGQMFCKKKTFVFFYFYVRTKRKQRKCKKSEKYFFEDLAILTIFNAFFRFFD